MWWMPNSKGYTGEIVQAGRYTYDDAVDIVREANKHLPATVEETMCPDFTVKHHYTRHPQDV